MIKACIFDLDGTLADSVESIAYSANRAIADFGFSPNPVGNYKYYAGDGPAEMLKKSLLDAGDKKLVYFESVKERYSEYFKKDCMYHVKPYDGIPEVLKALKKQGKLLAVLSNKPHERTVEVIRTLFGENTFDKVLGLKESAKRKPDSEGAIHITKEFSVLPSECMYVGDTDTDMKTGTAAGMLTVGVTWGFRDREELKTHRAHVIIDSPYELLDIQEEP